jgi:nucleotide-binding universal stress UspA family protein
VESIDPDQAGFDADQGLGAAAVSELRERRLSMTYSTLLAHMDLENSNDAVLTVSAGLADVLHADVIGVTAGQPVPCFTEMPAAEVIELDRAEMNREIGAAESSFRSAMMGHARQISFRSDISYGDLADFIATEARAADLIVTAPALPFSMMDTTRRTDIGALVMRAGRPVLIVPRNARRLELNSAVIAWKDGREARRAVADALPLLERAKMVTVVEIASEANLRRADGRVKDVADWLAHHGIGAETLVRQSGKSDTDSLYRIFDELDCDLVVAGAYSHSRLREWGFGGVTMDLLMSPDRCALLSN